MLQPKTQRKYIDLVITEAKPSVKSKLFKNYRICTISRGKTGNFINLRVPVSIQHKIINAYSHGKQVRIFA